MATTTRPWCGLLSLVLVLANCTNGETGLAGGVSGSASASHSASVAPGTPSTAPSISPQVLSAREQQCQIGERALVRRLAYPLQLVTDEVMRSLDGSSVAAARPLAARADPARRRVLKLCDHPSAEMRRYLRVATSQSDDVLSDRDLRTVMSAHTAWAETVGAGSVAHKLTRSQVGCRELKRMVEAAFRVRWRWTKTGRTWWIELRYRNRLTRGLEASLDGAVRASAGVDEKSEWSFGGYRPAGVLRWGGSSYDSATTRPGVSTRLVFPAAGPYVGTASDGIFSVQRVEVAVYMPGVRAWWCSLPVPERS